VGILAGGQSASGAARLLTQAAEATSPVVALDGVVDLVDDHAAIRVS